MYTDSESLFKKEKKKKKNRESKLVLAASDDAPRSFSMVWKLLDDKKCVF